MVLLLAWSRECLHEKENGKVYKDDLFNSFCGCFGKKNAKQDFFILLRHFSKIKGFFKKKFKTGKGKIVPAFFSNKFQVSNLFVRGSIRKKFKTKQIPAKIVSKF